MQLGDNCKRGIETTLVALDEAICPFEQWANGREQRSVFYSERNALSPAQRGTILPEVAGMRHMLQELRDDLGLEGRVRGGANDTLTKKCLIVEYLDPRVKRLISSINHLFRLVEKSRI